MNAQGNAAPLRVIQGPKTQFNWPTGLAVDEERGELYVANDIESSILVFNVTDSGDVAPKRVIQGLRTNLANPTGVWVDLKNNEVWAANFMNHSATVYPLGASGDVAPLRVIRSGPWTRRHWASAIHIRWLTTPGASKSWSPTEWRIRRLRYSPGWRIRMPSRFERSKARRRCLAAPCMASPTMKSTTNL